MSQLHLPQRLKLKCWSVDVRKLCSPPCPSRKHTYIILISFNPTFIYTLLFTGIHIIFLISEQNYEKNIRLFIWKFSVFGGEIFYILNRRVFVMRPAPHKHIFLQIRLLSWSAKHSNRNHQAGVNCKGKQAAPIHSHQIPSLLMQALRKHAYSNILKTKKGKFSDKKEIWYFFSYFCSKHRLWVLVWTALARRF